MINHQVLKQPGSLGPGTLVKQITKGATTLAGPLGSKPPLSIVTTAGGKMPLPVMLPKSPISIDAIKASVSEEDLIKF